MGNISFEETALVDAALISIAELLPSPWSIRRSTAPQTLDRTGIVAELVGPGSSKISYAVSIWPAGGSLASTASAELVPTERGGLPVLYVADYLGPRVRQRFADAGLSYADGTGWVRMTSSTAPILLIGEGSVRSVRQRGSSAVVRFNGPTTGKVIRTLLTAAVPIGVRDLATAAGASPGSVSKILATLASEDLIVRDAKRQVVGVRKRDVMYRWVADYSFAESNPEVTFYLAPRGTDRVLSGLSDLPNVSATGSVAARRLLPEGITPVVPVRLVAVYAALPAGVARELRLVETEPATANVVIARPQDPGIVEPIASGLPPAPSPLVVADLLTLPGRGVAEADQLMDALAITDESWSA